MVKPKKRGRKLEVKIGPYKKSEIQIATDNLKILIRERITYLNKLLRSL